MCSDQQPPRVWLLWCRWSIPYTIENQNNLLGIFSTEQLAEHYAKVHGEYAASDYIHADLECEIEVHDKELDVYAGNY